MKLRFDDGKLARMADDADFTGGFSLAIVQSYRRRVKFLRDVHSELDLYAWKSLHFEKLKGKRRHQRSLRLNNQFRLTVELDGDVVAIKGIEDYH